jgi:hypothetical protein
MKPMSIGSRDLYLQSQIAFARGRMPFPENAVFVRSEILDSISDSVTALGKHSPTRLEDNYIARDLSASMTGNASSVV